MKITGAKTNGLYSRIGGADAPYTALLPVSKQYWINWGIIIISAMTAKNPEGPVLITAQIKKPSKTEKIRLVIIALDDKLDCRYLIIKNSFLDELKNRSLDYVQISIDTQ